MADDITNESSSEVDKSNIYNYPRNMVFLGGMKYSNKTIVLDMLEEQKIPWLKILRKSYAHLEQPKILYDSEFNKMSLQIAEHSINVYNACKLAYDNLNSIILIESSPIDTFIQLHAMEQCGIIGDDEHYLLCDTLATFLSPFNIMANRTIIIYPDLFTVLSQIPEEEKDSVQSLYETWHFMYTTYVRNNIAKFMPYCKWIETSNMEERTKQLLSYLEEYNDDYLKNPIPKLVHPAITKDRKLVEQDIELQKLQKDIYGH